MFVSSYNTYINTQSTQRVQRERESKSEESSFSLATQSDRQSSSDTLSTGKRLPISYISEYKVMQNQQKLQEGAQESPEKTKFTKVAKQQNAQLSYSQNATRFSLLIEPKATLSQTPKLDTSLAKELQVVQESTLRNSMIKAYRANDSYYKITAA